jgi:UDP-N-acetylmuramoyl-L-alanyl-D-glutamate--2,6-diaminopimelate ligase
MAATKTLSQLGLAAPGGGEVRVSGIAVDSRQVRPGQLFAAMPGTRLHGAEHAAAAVARGAAAILTDPEGAAIAGELDAAMVVVEDPRAALAYAAALWSGSQPETVVAVTGTNGKTSVATFTRQIWERLGLDAVNVGTTGVEGAWSAPLRHTTPEPVTLHRLLAEMAGEGVTHAAMEASSHGLAQRRLDGVRLRAAAFTNISRDHLDYHASFDDYFAAKARLFDHVLPEEGAAVVDIDGDWGLRMAAVARERGQDLLTVGTQEGADLRILAQRFDDGGQDLRYEWRGAPQIARLALVGGFQARNALAAAGLVMACGAEPEEVFRTLPRLETVRGRMQRAAVRGNGAPVYVDYSHTPAAVETALAALRPHVLGRLVVVLGAGGDRDRDKRPMMGRAAAEGADAVFVTDDNPRSEDPRAIRAAVMEGAPDAAEVADRAEAILRAVDSLGPGDALLVAGKGHETGQEVAGVLHPFDDAEQASIAVAALDGLRA